MLVQEYLSIRQAIDFVFELTGEKIDGSTLEELSNIEKLTPVFLFSGYVSYPDINYKTIRYDKMKAYFTHDDFFMHQTKNYEGYSMFGDADVPEWIEIHSPFTIQKIIKQQSKAYSVFDEVFLFKNPPIGEVDKLDDLKYSNIDFDEVRFSKNELLGLFSNVNKIGESQKKADDKSKLASKENDNLSLEQSPQVTKLQKRIDELEKELNVFKEGSNDIREVIKVNFTDDEYRDIVELANQDGVSESEYVSNAVMKAIDTIYPFIKAFDLNDDENLSKARSKFLNYLKENKNSFEVFSMLADAEIFPREHSHFSSSQELNIKDSAYCLIAVLKNLLLNPDIGAYHFKTDNNNSTNKPTQTGLANYIDEMKIFGIKKDNINILFQEANKKLKDIKKKSRPSQILCNCHLD